jgi:hypothetical protein
MFVDPQDEFRVASGEPPDDADRRTTSPASTPSEEGDVTFLDDEDPEVGHADDLEPDADDSSRPSR